MALFMGFRKRDVLYLSSLVLLFYWFSNKDDNPGVNGLDVPRPFPGLLDATIEDVAVALQAGAFSSVDLVKAYTSRIAEVNGALHAISELNPDALAIAQQLDLERSNGRTRGPLHGVPLLLKDNIATADSMNNTAGSYALLGATVPRDATVAAKLRDAGAILLGKTTLSEWAYFRSTPWKSTMGWSPIGGQGFGVYHPWQSPIGSSSGSGIAMSIGLAPAAVGTETLGSIIEPASINNVVGIKPTVGLTSRSFVVPISEHQDTIGPMTRTVKDAAYVLQAIAGYDPHDNYTSAIPNNGVLPDYVGVCKMSALSGARIGIARNMVDNPDDYSTPYMLSMFEAALKTIHGAGATIVENANFTAGNSSFLSSPANLEIIATVMKADFVSNIHSYFASLSSNPNGITDLESLRTFTKQHPLEEYPDRDVGEFDRSIALGFNNTDPRFWDAYLKNLYYGGEGGILGALDRHNLDAIVLPSSVGPILPALVGSPLISVPLGFMPEGQEVEWDQRNETVLRGPGIPFGISFLGRKWSEEKLIGYAYAFEQRTNVRAKGKPLIVPRTEIGDVQSIRTQDSRHEQLGR